MIGQSPAVAKLVQSDSIIRSSALFSTEITSFGCIVEQESPKRINVLEPLSWKAPSIARPYCCYICTVIFYVYPYVILEDRGFQEWDRVDTLLTWDTDLRHDAQLYRCGGGRVIRRNGTWWMKHLARLRVENAPGERRGK